MWASSKSPEIPTSANWVCSHKTFDKEKSPGRFYPIIMSWERYKKYYLGLENMGFGLDVSRVDFDDALHQVVKPGLVVRPGAGPQR